MGEVEVAIERRAAPNAPRLDAAMIRRRMCFQTLHHSGAARLEQQSDIALQRRLVALNREMNALSTLAPLVRFCSSLPATGKAPTFFGRNCVWTRARRHS